LHILLNLTLEDGIEALIFMILIKNVLKVSKIFLNI